MESHRFHKKHVIALLAILQQRAPSMQELLGNFVTYRVGGPEGHITSHEVWTSFTCAHASLPYEHGALPWIMPAGAHVSVQPTLFTVCTAGWALLLVSCRFEAGRASAWGACVQGKMMLPPAGAWPALRKRRRSQRDKKLEGW